MRISSVITIIIIIIIIIIIVTIISIEVHTSRCNYLAARHYVPTGSEFTVAT